MKRYINEAMFMADEKKEDRKKIQWTHAFLIACNWLLYQEGKRILSSKEIEACINMYGGFNAKE